ncbi:MAG: cytochrome C [Sulfurovaceae bacterium]|nr:cytochrome C [Sulfurovaceae bacterium]
MKSGLYLSLMILFVGGTSLFAEVTKGEKIYTKQLQKQCRNMSGADFAAKHSQDEWEEIYDAGALASEIKSICGGKSIDEKLLPHIYDFAYEYANDSAKVPTQNNH